MSLSVCIITLNEEANIGRTLKSVKDIADEIIVVDSGSTDATVTWRGHLGRRYSWSRGRALRGRRTRRLEKATCDWILSLDADEEVSPELAASIKALLASGARRSLRDTR